MGINTNDGNDEGAERPGIISRSYLGSNKRRMIMDACYECSLRHERFDAYDVLKAMHDCAFRRRHARLIGPGHVMPTPMQVQRIMAGAPYLVKAGKQWRRTQYRFDPRFAEWVKR